MVAVIWSVKYSQGGYTIATISKFRIVLLRLRTERAILEQPLQVFCKKSCSEKFHKIHRKIPAPKSVTKEVCNFI